MKRGVIAATVLCFCAVAATAADLFGAIQEGDVDAVIEAVGADRDCVKLRSRSGMTPLHYAACYNQLEIAWRLVEAGADVNATATKHELTPAHCAADKNAVDVLRFLISKGADVDARAGNGWTPLHFAARGGRRESIRCLLKANADPDATDNAKCTPLHVAAQSNNATTIKTLLESGANSKTVDASGRTAADLATDKEAKLAFSSKHASAQQAKNPAGASSAQHASSPAAIGRRETVKTGSSKPAAGAGASPRTVPPGGVKTPPREAERAILYINADGSERYEGGFKKGRKHGKGVYHYAGGATLSSTWENDTPHGRGVYTAPGGTSIKGFWYNGHFIEGSGTFTTSDGTLYSGTWSEGYLQSAVPIE